MATPLSVPPAPEPPRRWRRLAATFGAGLLDALAPPSCILCAEPVADQGGLCGTCFRGITAIATPFCAVCGVPFAHAGVAGQGGRCVACLAAPRAFDRARAALVYDDGAKPLLLGFKHADRTQFAAPLAAMMARAGRDLLAQAELVTPVPLHWRRFVSRRYNQSALLSRHLARQARLPHIPDLLVRTRPTPPLGDKGAQERAALLAEAFRVRARFAHRVAGRRVLLVDDVLTSGATVGECARVLKAAGATAVDVLAAARVPAPRREQ